MEKPRRSGAGRLTETALFDASETAEDKPNYEGPEKGARANHEYDRPAA